MQHKQNDQSQCNHKKKEEREIDKALEGTFPASDPTETSVRHDTPPKKPKNS